MELDPTDPSQQPSRPETSKTRNTASSRTTRTAISSANHSESTRVTSGRGAAPLSASSHNKSSSTEPTKHKHFKRKPSLGGIDPNSVAYPLNFEFKSATGGYNRAKIPPEDFRKMPQITRSKFLTYEKPDETIQRHVVISHVRANVYLKEKHELERQKQIELDRRKNMKAEASKLGEGEGSKMAQERMKQRGELVGRMRERELQYIVEGQKSSIDAIKLKDYLTYRQRPNFWRMEREILSPKDKARLSRIML